MSIYAQIACSLPDKVEIIEAGDIAELVYYRSILRSRDNLTDGVIDRRLIDRWFAGIRGNPATHLNRLRDAELLLDHPDGWCIPPDVWCKWNPTKAEVEDKRAAETERKRRWKERRDSDNGDEGATNTRQRRVNRRDAQPESKTETEPKTEESLHLSTHQIRVVDNLADEEDPRFDHVVDHITRLRAERSKPNNVKAWSMKVKAGIRADESPRIADLLDRYPGAPYDVVAAAVEGDSHALAYHQPQAEPETA